MEAVGHAHNSVLPGGTAAQVEELRQQLARLRAEPAALELLTEKQVADLIDEQETYRHSARVKQNAILESLRCRMSWN